MLFKSQELKPVIPPIEHEDNFVEFGDAPLLETVLTSLHCTYRGRYYYYDDPTKYLKVCFVYEDDNNDYKNYTLSEGDYINIFPQPDGG